MYLFHLVEEKLTHIAPELPKLYGALGVLAELGYWVTPDGVEETAASSAAQSAGVESLEKDESGVWVITAKAITFPYLMHELVKGIYEYLSLSKDTEGLMKGERLKHETRDVLAGPALFKKIFALVPAERQKYMPLIQKKLIALNPKDAQEIIGQSDKGKQLFQEIMDKSEQEWESYKNPDTFKDEPELS
jgi:hypothetical protein